MNLQEALALAGLSEIEEKDKLEEILELADEEKFYDSANRLDEIDFEKIREQKQAEKFSYIYYRRALTNQFKEFHEDAIRDLEKSKKFSNLSNDFQTLVQERLTAIRNTNKSNYMNESISIVEDLFEKKFSEIDLIDECKKQWRIDEPKRWLSIDKIDDYSCIGVYRWSGDPKRNDLIPRLIREQKKGSELLTKLFALFLFKHIEQSLSQMPWFIKVDYLMPVPSDPQRTAERRMDITSEISTNLRSLIGIPCLTEIVKRKFGSTSSKESSLTNLRDQYIFQKKRKSRIVNRSILLIDDVVTRGKTSRVCAELLKDNGCSNVYLLAIAQSESTSVSEQYSQNA